jgi:hypothetical protein
VGTPSHTPATSDRRPLVALFIAATFGMMVLLTFPLVRFMPQPSRAPGFIGLPSLLDPLRPLLLPPSGSGWPSALAHPDIGVSRILATVLPSEVEVLPGPGAEELVPPTVAAPTVTLCPSEASGEGPAECGLTRPVGSPSGTVGPTGSIARPGHHRDRSVTKHAAKHSGKEHPDRSVTKHAPKHSGKEHPDRSVTKHAPKHPGKEHPGQKKKKK